MGLLKHYAFQALGFTAEMERDFVKKDLGTELHAAGLSRIKLMIFDDNRQNLRYFGDAVLKDIVASKYVSGVAVHWYNDAKANTSSVTFLHNKYKDKFFLSSEACHEGPPVLGSWEHAEAYASDIITNLNNWYSGWVDWNVALDMGGGPNWVSNFVDSPILVNASAKEFYKQPMYYILGHFSKFLKEGYRRVHHVVQGSAVEVTAWRGGRTIAIVALNR